MRKALAVAAVAALMVPMSVDAQMLVGVGGGFRSSSLTFQPEETEILQDSRTGYQGFGFLGFPMSETFRLQIGAGYGQKGAKDTAGATDQALELAYLEVPLLGVVSLPSQGSVGLHFFAGPVVGYELSCQVTGESQSEALDCSDEQIEIATKSLDVGALFGAAVSLSLSETMSVFVDGYYSMGLSNIQEDPSDGESVKNKAFGIDLGLVFRRGG